MEGAGGELGQRAGSEGTEGGAAAPTTGDIAPAPPEGAIAAPQAAEEAPGGGGAAVGDASVSVVTQPSGPPAPARDVHIEQEHARKVTALCAPPPTARSVKE
jgi:hypothetical protein